MIVDERVGMVENLKRGAWGFFLNFPGISIIIEL